MKMKRVKLIEEELSAVGFGCWCISGPDSWTGCSDEDSIEAVHKAIELGVNFFDVAPVYGFGHAEETLGRAIKGFNRNELMIASKVGLVWDSQYRIQNCLKPESILREIDSSLKRLNTDHIDIYQIHWPDPSTPIEETMETLVKLKQAGKIRYIGVSNFSTELTERAMKIFTIASQQCLYNMLERNPESYHNIPLEYRTEKEILPFCKRHEQAFFPYSPLFQGLLTDNIRNGLSFDKKDVRNANPKLNGETAKRNLEIVGKLRAIAEEIGKPLSQMAINWLIQNEAVTSVICGIQKTADIVENVASMNWQLDTETMKKIENVIGDSAE